MGSPWTDQNVELLKTLWEEDALSASQIGTELKMSKNAVIGKAHRLGLTRKTSAPRSRERAKVVRNGNVIRTIRPKTTPLAPPTGLGIHIVDLEHEHCRAIVGTGQDGLARYCGSERRHAMDHRGYSKVGTDGLPLFRGSFCDFHARAYFQPLAR